MAQPIYLIMGVSGSGKSTLGRALSEQLQIPLLDADGFHSRTNIAKMARGEPLTDSDRKPWLAAIRQSIEAHQAAALGAVFTCSALKRAYRVQLVKQGEPITCVYLHAPRDVLEQRLRARTDHFFDPELLADQLDTLQPPAPDESIITVDGAQSIETLMQAVLEHL